jgi:hypothetical protein
MMPCSRTPACARLKLIDNDKSAFNVLRSYWPSAGASDEGKLDTSEFAPSCGERLMHLQ